MSDQIKGALKGGSRDEATLELSRCNQKVMGEEGAKSYYYYTCVLYEEEIPGLCV